MLHARYNPEQITALNIVPGLIGMILTLSTLVMTTLAITRERETGTMENLLAMPVRPVEVMLGKIIPYVGLAYVQTALILTVSVTVFAVPVRGSIPLLLFGLGVFIACNLAMGFAFSTMRKNTDAGSAIGAVRPAAIDDAVRFYVPVPGHAGLGAHHRRGSPADPRPAHLPRHSAEGQRPAQIWPDLWPMALFALMVGVIAVSMYRETLD